MTETGSASTLAVAVLGLGLTLGVVLMGVTGLASGKVAAQTAADAAALAAAAASHPGFGDGGQPCREAARLAAANRTRLLTCRARSDRSFRPRVAEVTVALDIRVPLLGPIQVVADAEAEFDPVAALTGS